MDVKLVLRYADSWLPVLLVWGVVFLLLGYWEVRRPNRQRLVFRLSALALAMVALAALALQPAWQTRKRTEKIVLLTARPLQSTLDSLSRLNPQALWVDYAGQSGRAALPSVVDLAHLARQYPAVAEVIVVGEGIPAYDLPVGALPFRLTLVLNPTPSGIQALQLPQNLQAQTYFTIEGQYAQAPTAETYLVLADEGKGQDSVLLKGSGGFQLKGYAPLAGQLLYKIRLREKSGKIIREEPLPLVVAEGAQPRVWIFNASPSFESKYLKNMLGDAGYSVATRSVVSKGKFKDERVNADQADFQLAGQLSQAVDLIVMDAAYWALLSPAEQGALRYAVAEQGVGLLWLLSESDPAQMANNPLMQGFGLVAQNQDTVQYKANNLQQKQPVMLRKIPFQFTENPQCRPLLKSQQGNSLAVYRPWGVGKVGISLLSQTFPLVLQGHSKIYAEIWHQLLNPLSQKPQNQAIWHTDSWLVYPHRPMLWRLQTAETQPVALLQHKAQTIGRSVCTQHPDWPQHWLTSLWANEAGWHHLATAKDSLQAKAFYVMPTENWQALHLHTQRRSNEAWVGRQSAIRREALPAQYAAQTEPIAVGWWFVWLLLAVAYLWIERKL
ncbi:MAG TPA: hypothetical protein DCM08_08565 [Microscillaceae bacterium]|jgi:hypothetical protein|nr:hypothetical protein [Microscillaceae bacterium]